MNELALFAGIGGGIIGGHLLGWRCQCAVERYGYARRVLLARQRDGMLPRFPIWDDVSTFDGRPWRDKIDVISGGFPCQDISEAGNIVSKRRGLDGPRSGLVREMLRIIGEVRPAYVFSENSPKLRIRGLHIIAGELARMGYVVRWGIVGGNAVGACHSRARMWIVADSTGQRSRFPKSFDEMERDGFSQPTERGRERIRSPWWSTEPGLSRLDAGASDRVDRTRAIGNSQIPSVAALAWRMLS